VAARGGVTLNKVSEERVRALLIAGDPLLYDLRAEVIAFSLASQIPTFHTWPEEAVDGAVAAYGAELADEYRQAAVYVAKVLAGAAPADLPVDQAMRFQFVLSMKTASDEASRLHHAARRRDGRVAARGACAAA
jgi:putative tryptophan/tyrosine transport system substrate-binding protein